MYLGSRLWYYC